MELENDPRDPHTKPSPKREGSQAWRGTPMHILNKLADTGAPHGPLKPTETHKVMFQTPFTYDPNSTKPPKVFPNFLDKWDQYHVRMPCSNMNEYPVNNKILKRWDLIQRVLIAEIESPQDFAEKVLEYNNQYYEKWDFKTFISFFDVASKEEKQHFFSSEGILRKMANLALQLPHLCPTPIPLLKRGTNMSVTLSQQQIGCLLANAFFCTFPRRNSRKRSSEFFNYPTINFNTLLCGPPSVVRFEKLRCIFHYFRRVFKKMPLGTVTFTRQCIKDLPIWFDEKTTLRGLHVSSEGTIEDDGKGLLQVDFANMFLGGGVLGNGCVQEEIRFLICPEMMVSRLFTECLDKNECLIMTGCERFSDYTGYSSTFEWKEDYIDVTPRDIWGRIQCEVVAIDALVIYDHKSQFKMGSVMRELNKAYCGFASVDPNIKKLPAVCTGNWGCGAFGGDKQLKALIQLMAAAKAGRDLCYFTFDDVKLRDDIYELHKYLTSDNPLSINQLLKVINSYRAKILQKSSWTKRTGPGLYEYILGSPDGADIDQLQDEDLASQPESHNAQSIDPASLEFGSEEYNDDDDIVVSEEKKLKRDDSIDYKANTP
ncbi:poly(ADP-ribose) glycohydrolase-like [Dreissena polymorpha]|uniref:poly(ADP-ribose) glycohydrolase-like n=1 Tax=Dreissena polymorpha TaxID=45954 RepID=UPI002263B5AE|nr:poly(ADP-ribose) glycohydrolase-like [Dreissena polymorpha]